MDYQDLNLLIDRLENQVHATDPKKGYWKELRALIREVGSGFKGTRYPSREENNTAWQRFQQLCEFANSRSEEDRKRIEQQERHSHQTLAQIESRAAHAKPTSDFERVMGQFAILPALFVIGILETIFGIKSETESEQVRNELINYNEKLKDAWSFFEEHKQELLPADKAHVFQTLTDAQEKLNQAWTEWKKAKFIAQIEANINKLKAKIEKKKNVLDHQETHLSKLQSDYASAWNDSFRDRCSEWINECEDRISDIKSDIERLEGWIDEERQKL